MRLSSSTSDPFAGTYLSPGASAFATPAAQRDYLLRVEAGLAVAAGGAGLVTAAEAQVVVDACTPSVMSVEEIQAGLVRDATPVIVLVERLRAAVPEPARAAVHPGATSQDIVDTAAMLYARDVIGVMVEDAVAIVQALGELAREHRSTAMAGRTLGQHAVPITVGSWAALRMRGIGDAAAHVLDEFAACGMVQCGGPVGSSTALAAGLAAELGLRSPVSSWHTSRSPVARIAAAVAILAGEVAGLAQDIVLLSGTEIGELVPAAPGGSSAMPHKRNPSRAVNALAAAQRVPGALSTIVAMMPQGLQRDPGRWQAEWGAWSDVLQLTAGTVHHARAAMDGIAVDADAVERHVRGLLDALGESGAAHLRDAEALVDTLLGRP